MKLSDIEVDDLIAALQVERTSWINAAVDEGRKSTEAEKTEICLLAAIERTFKRLLGMRCPPAI